MGYSIAILFCCRFQATLEGSAFLSSGKSRAAPLWQCPCKDCNAGTVIVNRHHPQSRLMLLRVERPRENRKLLGKQVFSQIVALVSVVEGTPRYGTSCQNRHRSRSCLIPLSSNMGPIPSLPSSCTVKFPLAPLNNGSVGAFGWPVSAKRAKYLCIVSARVVLTPGEGPQS